MHKQFDYIILPPVEPCCPKCGYLESVPAPLYFPEGDQPPAERISISGVTGLRCPHCHLSRTGPYIRGEKEMPAAPPGEEYYLVYEETQRATARNGQTIVFLNDAGMDWLQAQPETEAIAAA